MKKVMALLSVALLCTACGGGGYSSAAYGTGASDYYVDYYGANQAGNNYYGYSDYNNGYPREYYTPTVEQGTDNGALYQHEDRSVLYHSDNTIGIDQDRSALY